ncbi:MAG TPA: CusA/CzcA family heavy metal efflux RND transporter [Thermoanaerobaculia bacterium]|nr:CusA/CzcA family heavy metal efflux RND transporter [Thermoanaerobaculia bacterium]
MIRALVAWALRRRVIVLALLVVFVAFGVFAFVRLPVEAYPDVTNVQAQIITLFPGHAAEEVERLVTIPVENEMNGIPKRASMRSISIFGLSVVTIVFEDDADRAYVRNQAFERLQSVTLPGGAQANLSPDSTPVGEIYRYTVVGPPGFSPLELKSLEDWVVERKLRTVPGVVDVVGFGGPTKQYQVNVDPLKLKSYGLTLAQVFDALSKGNRNAGGAYIEHGSEMYVVRGLGLVQSTADIGEIAVATRNGTPIRIRDVGTAGVGPRIRLGRVGKTVGGVDEDDVVQGIVLLRKGENALEVLERVRAKVAEINAGGLPPGVKVVPHYDRTALIDRTLHTVRKNMAEGIGFVLVVLVAFLGIANARSALVVAAVVPLSLLGAFLLLDLRGIPANLISMGAIDFGIIVDSAVVVVENLLRILEERGGKVRSLSAAIVQATSEVGKPILFSKAILITAFLPLFTLQRVEGKIFRPMALTLTFALIWGTVLALTIVPVLASFAVKHRGASPAHGEAESGTVRFLTRLYRPALAWVLSRRKTAVAASAALLAAGVGTALLLGSEFLPKLDEGALWVRATFPGSISPSEAGRLTRQIRATLASFPEVTTIVSQLGRPDDGTDVNGFDTVELYVDLLPRDKWTTAKTRDALSDAMNRRLSAIPGIELTFSQVIEDNVNEAVSGIKSELSVKIFGEDPVVLQDLADRAAAVIDAVPGAADVAAERLSGQPQVQISVDRPAIGRYGLSVSDVQTVIETALGGAVATQILEGEKTFDLVVRVDPGAVTGLDSIRAIPILGPNGEKLTLGSVADVRLAPGSARVFREENSRRIAVKLSVRGRDLGSLVSEAQKKVDAAVKLPPGYRMEWTGSFENQQRALKRLGVVLPITLAAIFFLLFAAFDSPRLATLILLNVPFAAVGGLFALPLAGLTLSVSALVGFIALFGVSVQNGVLLVERIRELRRTGKALADAVTEGALTRFRPVLMTAAMAAFGLLPAALSHAVGAETQRPFAVVIIGGLVTATLLTLFVLPVLYELFEREEEEY